MMIQLPTTDKAMVEQLIPQKYPFVMVDTLVEYTETSLTSQFKITDENIFVKSNQFQASGIIEHQAQSVALHTGYQFHIKGLPTPTGFIGAIKSAEILQLPKVNDVVETKVNILNEMMGVTLVKAESFINGTLIASSEMKTVVKD